MTAESAPAHDIDDLYDRAPCALATITRRGDLISMNQMMRDMVGGTAFDEAGGFFELLRPGDRIFWETHVSPLLDMQGRVQEIAIELTTDGGALPALMNARNTRPGAPTGTIDLALFPAHDRRSYERQLLEARRRAEASEETARELATTLQASLIPPSLPTIEGIDLGAAYLPAGSGAEVGGDFYDCFRVDQAEWVIALGDVCGKGARAATVTALVRYTIRGAAMETADLPDILRGVNNALLLDETHETCTAVVARMRPSPTGPRVALSSAGHPLPRLVTPTGEVEVVGQHGPLLGAFPDTAHRTTVIDLGPGEALVLFTDGVTEARRGDEFFGEDRLHDLLSNTAEADAVTSAHAVANAALEYQHGEPRDDIAVVVIRRLAHDG